MLNVVFICADRSGPFFHDIHIPANYFQKYNLLRCSFSDGGLTDEKLRDADIIVFQRQHAPEALMTIRKLKAMRKVCIFIIDDDVWALPKNNPAHPEYQGLVIDRYNTALHECDAAWTSTEHIRIKGLAFNKHITVLRNLVEPVYMEFLHPGRDNPNEIRVGWFGTQHHHDDIIRVEPVLKKIARKYSQVKFVFMGYYPPHILELMDRSRWEYYQFVETDAFYPALANLDFDIGIAPLVDNDFNRGKTARKAQEYALFSIPMVLANVITYREWTHGVDCLKPKNNKEDGWVYDLSRMIEDKDLREELAIEANKHVLREHDVHKFIRERAKFFYDTFSRVKGTSLEVPNGDC
jgi:hypothetical protein